MFRLRSCALVLVLAAGCTASAGTPVAHPPRRTAPRSPVSTGSRQSPRIARPHPRPVTLHGPWHLKAVAGPLARAVPLVAEPTALVVQRGRTLLRVMSDGAVTARHTLPSTAFVSPVLSNGALWIANPRDVLALDARTLTTLARLPLRRASLTAAQGSVYVWQRRSISVIDAARRRIVRRLAVPIAHNSWGTVAAAGHTLFAGIMHDGGNLISLIAIDARTGRLVQPPVLDPTALGIGVLAAMRDGVWVAESGGMHEALVFRSRPSLEARPARTPTIVAGGGFPITVTAERTTDWIGSTNFVACADPTSGYFRAVAKVGAPHHDAANLSHLIRFGGRVYGYYMADAGPTGYLVRMAPPARCAV